MDRAQAKQAAKQQIRGKIGILFVMFLIMAVVSLIGSIVLAFIPLVGPFLAMIMITPAFALSLARVYLNLVTGDGNVTTGDAFSGFNDFWSAFKVDFLTGLFTFLWSLLFVIPGIIKMLSYSMSMYILAENKGMPALKCIKRSQQMTDGHKMELFILVLSFLGWLALVIVTGGLAAIYVIPYSTATWVNYYESFKQNMPELPTAGSASSNT